jgi:sterol desaturase/sphingolipid hydroxylase (fatty acid hydroxylase superfamily)
MPQLPDPVLYAIPAFLGLILIELWAVHAGARGRYEAKDAFASLAMGVGNMLTGILAAGLVVSAALWVFEHRLFELKYVWWLWPLCFVLDDFFYYIFHRCAHRCRWFWASHVIHHSSQHYNLTTALRQTWTGNASFSFIFRLPLFLIGFPPAMVFFCAGLNLIYQFWFHTEAIDRCPRWIESLFNTPSHHRVHHATNARYLDANYAGVFIIWDRLFGSFVAETPDEPCSYGLVHNLDTHNPLRIATHEWTAMARDVAQSRSAKQVIGHILGPPGWSLDGSRETSDSIKAQWRAQQTHLQAAE